MPEPTEPSDHRPWYAPTPMTTGWRGLPVTQAQAEAMGVPWTPDLWPLPHDHKGYSEEQCVRCGWVMGHPPLNCMNDDTPHIFPSQIHPATASERSEQSMPAELLGRLRVTRATMREASPQDRALRDAILYIETLRAEYALMGDTVFHLWDEMDDQSCINFSATHPRLYIAAEDEWQRRNRARATSTTSSPEATS